MTKLFSGKEVNAMLGGRKIIAMCTSLLSDIENSRFIMQLNKLLAENNSSLFIYAINSDLHWDDRNIRADSSVFSLIDYSVTDAVIIMYEKIKSTAVTERIIKEASEHGVSVIMVDGEHPGCTGVRYDYGKGFEALVRHVMEVHHPKRPHFLGGFKDNPYSIERLEVFRKVIEEYGFTFTDDMVSYGNFWAAPARAAAEKLFGRSELPDAVICANDIMAINVCSVIFGHGLKVPDDIIVTGFDGIDEINFMYPRITSAYCGTAGLSESVFNIITDILEKGIVPEPEAVVPKPVFCDSCGCKGAESAFSSLRLGHFNDRFYRYQDDNIKLAAVAEGVQLQEDTASAADCIRNMMPEDEILSSLSIIIDRRATENTFDYFEKMKKQYLGDELFLFYDSDDKDFIQRGFSRSEIIPNAEKVIARGYPLIFNVISFMDAPIGYICFHYYSYDEVNYCCIPAIVSSLSWGMGGFVNMQYQRYLTSRIEDMYRFDHLTGLYTRLSFQKEYERLMKSLEGRSVPVTVIITDLDGLKYINDNCGHSAGDNAISVTARALQNSCPPGALCVRYGGDEMLAVIDGECDLVKIKTGIKNYLDTYNRSHSLEYEISASVGIYCTDSSDMAELDQLVRRSDADMYAEKQAKKKKK